MSRTGRGPVDGSPDVRKSVAQFVLGDHLAGLSWDPAIGPTGYPRLEHRRPYATKDGYLCVLVYNNKQWKLFLEAVGRQELMADSRFSTQANRAKHIGEIYDFLAGLMRERTTAEWMALLEAADIPVSPLNSVEDVVSDPHLAASGFFTLEEHEREGRVRAMRTPTDWSDSPPEALRPAPRLGEHSAEVLREAAIPTARSRS